MKTRNWILFFFLLVLLCAGLSAVFLLAGEDADFAEVYSDGKLIFRVDLSKNAEYRVDYGGEWNSITVKDGKISVSAASCASQDCVRHAPADHGAPIVCLPNRMVIKFVNSSELDALIG